jgi:hypothetical protein
MTAAKPDGRNIVVVDGSNIATEGRSMPSLAQLNEAVLSFRDERPDAAITVVVDATFGHRIDKSEKAEFDEAVAHNELVAPPAGAIGRGDAFVLSIANKVGATILSNDSFQEFHGDYPWLFDAGRLIGGKPVPNIGWVFVDRVPVKGPVSRKARSTAKRKAGAATPSARHVSKLASQPMPVPKTPPPGPARTKEPAPAGDAAPRRRHEATPVNDLLPFLEFVERHPVGSSVTGVVESYSSHGAYVTIGDLRGYVPLRLMGDPPPRSAREVMKLGEAVTLVVVEFAPARRNVDLSLPGAPAEAEPAAVTAAVGDEAPAKAPRTRKRSAARGPEATPQPDVAAEAPSRPRKASKSTKATKATHAIAEATTGAAGDADHGRGDSSAVETRPDQPTKQAAAKKTPAKKSAPAKKSSATKVPAVKQPAAAKVAAEKAPAIETVAKKSPAKKSPAKKSPAKQAAKKAPAKTAAAKQAATPDVAAAAAEGPAGPAKPARKRASKRMSNEAGTGETARAPRDTRAKKAAT